MHNTEFSEKYNNRKSNDTSFVIRVCSCLVEVESDTCKLLQLIIELCNFTILMFMPGNRVAVNREKVHCMCNCNALNNLKSFPRTRIQL